jgi:1L-myo-inositol 1-phosphate cytidylyltransferase
MDALIIAAGYGSRLGAMSSSKPLTPVCGVPIIELSIRQAMLAGVTRVVVVTGHEADRLEAFLAELSLRLDIAIVPVRLSNWSTPNGHSVIAGATRCDGNYLLLMADHLFDVEILSRLIAEAPADCGLTLAIDRRVDSPLIDPEDATWVKIDDRGLIRSIGKTIEVFDACDCGAFLATPELAPAIRAAIASGKAGSLSEGVQVLAQYNRAATLDIDDAWWIDIDDPHYHALAEETAPWHVAQALAEIGAHQDAAA